MPELTAWDSFYVIVGSAAGALIGLQFVVVTLLAQKPSTPVPEATAAFGTPTVVHLGAALLLSAHARAPWPTIVFPALLWGLMGLGGVVYAVIVIRRMRAQAAYIPEFEDWLFHIVLPTGAYALLALSALAWAPPYCCCCSSAFTMPGTPSSTTLSAARTGARNADTGHKQ